MSAPIDLSRVSPVLRCDDDGIWRARDASREKLSFPDDGHDLLFRFEDESFWFAHRNACIAAALGRHRIDGPVLDVGGGNGVVSGALEKRGLRTVLLEPGPEGASNARRRGLRSVVNATLEDARFADGTFAAAGAFDVVEHIADDEAILREVHRVLRQDGILCVTVPAYRWLWSAEDDVAGHQRRYTLSRLAKLLERCGFTVNLQTYLFAPLTVPVFLMRSLPHRLHRRSATAVVENATKQHTPSPTTRRVMEGLLAPEITRIERGKTIPFGTSCLAVATKR
jgi:SAM-dependent methyltransferase